MLPLTSAMTFQLAVGLSMFLPIHFGRVGNSSHLPHEIDDVGLPLTYRA
jgi:hypothetical protein